MNDLQYAFWRTRLFK
ncbi:hypothetical protein D047_0948A, partial [Vibrio parahaemolyticus VPTS-2010_2]